MEIIINSKIGGRTENQDAYGSLQTQYGRLIVVCDGMGGHRGGAHASNMAVDVVLDEMRKKRKWHNPGSFLKSAIETANEKIWNEGRSNSAYENMGTTIVAILITPQQAICCHVGDSRLYQLRDGEIIHRTFDHSYVFDLVKAGIMTEEEARVSSKSNIITRALGINSTVEVEIDDTLSYQLGDRFLLCTDGICGAIRERELVDLASLKKDIEWVTENLVEKIDAIGFESGGKHDNLTAALIEITEEDKKSIRLKSIRKRKSIFKTIIKLFKKK